MRNAVYSIDHHTDPQSVYQLPAIEYFDVTNAGKIGHQTAPVRK